MITRLNQYGIFDIRRHHARAVRRLYATHDRLSNIATIDVCDQIADSEAAGPARTL
jgi:hypothetical protein